MSLFENIVESMLNEITTRDAYNKFYSGIPSDEYFQIVGDEIKMNPILSFILNNVKTKTITSQEAIDLLSQYRQTDQLVKQDIQKKIKSKEYTIFDFRNDIKNTDISSLSRDNIAKRGLINICSDGDWYLTVTTNYEANHHFYGDSHWCTASARDGHYDGREYFNKYTVDSDMGCENGFAGSSFLAQMICRTDRRKSLQMEVTIIYDYDEIENPDDYDVSSEDTIAINQICDFEDNTIGQEIFAGRYGKIYKGYTKEDMISIRNLYNKLRNINCDEFIDKTNDEYTKSYPVVEAENKILTSKGKERLKYLLVNWLKYSQDIEFLFEQALNDFVNDKKMAQEFFIDLSSRNIYSKNKYINFGIGNCFLHHNDRLYVSKLIQLGSGILDGKNEESVIKYIDSINTFEDFKDLKENLFNFWGSKGKSLIYSYISSPESPIIPTKILNILKYGDVGIPIFIFDNKIMYFYGGFDLILVDTFKSIYNFPSEIKKFYIFEESNSGVITLKDESNYLFYGERNQPIIYKCQVLETRSVNYNKIYMITVNGSNYSLYSIGGKFKMVKNPLNSYFYAVKKIMYGNEVIIQWGLNGKFNFSNARYPNELLFGEWNTDVYVDEYHFDVEIHSGNIVLFLGRGENGYFKEEKGTYIQCDKNGNSKEQQIATSSVNESKKRKKDENDIKRSK